MSKSPSEALTAAARELHDMAGSQLAWEEWPEQHEIWRGHAERVVRVFLSERLKELSDGKGFVRIPDDNPPASLTIERVKYSVHVGVSRAALFRLLLGGD